MQGTPEHGKKGLALKALGRDDEADAAFAEGTQILLNGGLENEKRGEGDLMQQ